MKKIKGLCVLDVDGTLIEEEVIDLLGKEAECENEVALLTTQAMRGELDFEESLRKRVSLLKGLSVDTFDKIYHELHLSKNAAQFINTLQKNQIEVGLVSGGFTPVVERLAKDLGISLFAANRLEIRDGHLTGNLVGPIISREVNTQLFSKSNLVHCLLIVDFKTFFFQSLNNFLKLINDSFQCLESLIFKTSFLNFFPDLFNRVHFWCIRWDKSQFNITWNL